MERSPEEGFHDGVGDVTGIYDLGTSHFTLLLPLLPLLLLHLLFLPN